jgi:hypothetical protein
MLSPMEKTRDASSYTRARTIEDPPVVSRILAHVGLPTTVSEASPARSPPTANDSLAFDFPG